MPSRRRSWIAQVDDHQIGVRAGDAVTALGIEFAVHRRLYLSTRAIADAERRRTIILCDIGPTVISPSLRAARAPLPFGVLRDRRRSPVLTG